MDGRKLVPTIECFIRKDGKYLMLKRSLAKKVMPNVWIAPGGKREPGEGLFECVRREIKEETGLEIKNIRLAATGNAYLKDINQELLISVVTADYASGELQKESEIGKLAWLSLKEISQLDNLMADIKEMLPYLFKDDSKTLSFKAEYESGNKMNSFVLEDPS